MPYFHVSSSALLFAGTPPLDKRSLYTFYFIIPIELLYLVPQYSLTTCWPYQIRSSDDDTLFQIIGSYSITEMYLILSK